MVCGRLCNPNLRFGGIIFHAFALCALCAFFLIKPLQAQTQGAPEAGRVNVTLEKDYARIVFSFAQKPLHSVNSSALNSGILILKFDRPVNVELNAITQRLQGYVTSIQQDPDGRSLRFALAQKVRVNTLEAANDLYVDLLPEPWFGATPALPASVMANLMHQAQTGTMEQSFSLSAEQQATQLQPEEPENKPHSQQMQEPLKESQNLADERSDLIIPDTSALAGIGQRIMFPFRKNTAAAIFQRGRTLWMIFATDEKIDTSPISFLLERKLRYMSIEHKDKLAIMRLELKEPLLVSASTLNTAWLVTLSDKASGKSSPARLRVQSTPDGRDAVNGYMNRTVAVQKVQDPVAGDELSVVLAMGPPTGFARPQNFIDFTALATVQGAALQPHVDDLNVRLDTIGFVVERPVTMTVSTALAPRKHHYAHAINTGATSRSIIQTADKAGRQFQMRAAAPKS
jgi:hypothetical protein